MLLTHLVYLCFSLSVRVPVPEHYYELDVFCLYHKQEYSFVLNAMTDLNQGLHHRNKK